MNESENTGNGKEQRRTAVALQYDGDEAPPEVVASGQGIIAERIVQVALERGIEVRKDADLAELLGTLEVGDQIPVEAFAAVAEILAYIYRANGEAPEIKNQESPNAEPKEKTDE